ncbi:zinc-binding dehydrogenase [Amycolatopsis sp. GM8]|uniref:zinc-binding dehydrogenase n=1 Tax=Amycolatopsis sp. GM8 TaxID=2896530 RepID=UPI001F20DAC9|nr:alcohol dehydrogenase catalytic domain-containing protein [Amycolatopsis sp. GM8]
MEAIGAVLREAPATRPYTASRPLSLESVSLDPPQPGELLVRIGAAGVCHSDLSVIDGNRPRPLPMLLGHEAAGTVVDIGTGVHDVKVGDKVVLVYVPSCGVCQFCNAGSPALCTAAAAANGEGTLLRGGSRLRAPDESSIRHHLGVSAFASHAVVDRNSAVVVGNDVPDDIAALFGCAMLTGFGAVTHTASVGPGDSVAVFGLGGVGQAAVMSAAAAGANPLIAIDPIPAKQTLALELGATHACAPEDAAAYLARYADGGVDWAFEVAGSAKVLEAAYAATGRGGATVAVGLPHPDATFTMPALSIVATNRRILGSYMGSAQPQRDIPAMISLWRAGRLPVDRLKSAELPLSMINEAFEALADGTALRQTLKPEWSGR